MTGVVDIFNLALGAVGARASVSLPTEASREAEVCNLWYETARDAVLAAAPWPSTRAVARLPLVKERDANVDWDESDPYPGWRYLYGTPADMLRPRHLTTLERFEYASLADGTRVINAQTTNALLVYTRRQELIETWDAELKLAIAYALAAHIAMPLQGKDRRAQMLVERANERVLNARQGAGESDVTLEDNLPDWFVARGYGFSAGPRYVYPYGPLISVSEGISVR